MTETPLPPIQPPQKNILRSPDKGPERMHLPGERAVLREPRPEDPAEIARFLQIENGGAMNEVNETDEDRISPEEMPGWLKSLAERPHVTMKAITADAAAVPGSHDEVQGWFRIDQGTPAEGSSGSQEQARYERITGRAMGGNELDPCELTYVPMPDGTPDLMASALLTGCSLVETRDRAIPGDHPRRTVIVFQEPPTPETQESFDALEKCGFERKTQKLVRYDEDDGGEPDTHMYVLNWEKYDKLVAGKKPAASEQKNTPPGAPDSTLLDPGRIEGMENARAAIASAAQTRKAG